MPNPPAPTPRNLRKWQKVTRIDKIPQSAGIYRFRKRHTGKIRTQYLGLSKNLRKRIKNHNKLKNSDIIEYKLVSHPKRLYHDPVGSKKRQRLNLAEKLHLQHEMKNGQNCFRNKQLKNWTKKYNSLPKSKTAIKLVKRT